MEWDAETSREQKIDYRFPLPEVQEQVKLTCVDGNHDWLSELGQEWVLAKKKSNQALPRVM